MYGISVRKASRVTFTPNLFLTLCFTIILSYSHDYSILITKLFKGFLRLLKTSMDNGVKNTMKAKHLYCSITY